jgi:hypothetical protein
MNRFHSLSRRRFVASGLTLAASSVLPQAHAQNNSLASPRLLRIGYQQAVANRKANTGGTWPWQLQFASYRRHNLT